MARRINGEGSVFRDMDRGGWVGLLYVDGKRRKVRAKTKTDASARLAELRTAAADGVVANGNVTVGAVLEVWRERTLANRTLEPKTRDNYGLALRVLAAEFGKVRLRTLDVARVECGLDHIATGAYGRGKRLSRRSLKLYRATLVQVLDLAVRRKLVAANSAVHAELTPTAAPAVPRRALSESEAEALWDAVDGERLGPCWRLMLLTGLRPGEALGLCWDAVDFNSTLLHVWRAVRVERGKARLVDTLKTAPSYRTISLPEPAVELLRRQRGAVATLRLAARMWVTDDPGLVFPTINGTPWNPKNARNELKRACAVADMPDIRPNELRHTAATILNSRGVPLELIADLLGHVDTTMLGRVYRHRARPSADAAVAPMAAVFGGRTSAPS
jgi:integrase